ncbi:MAG: response regulator [Bacteroidetes bacterium]|nr:MAG: response regulator [Bacteroidota bacterium]REK08115.1 MAG: response regulator [Bacteroidota bacterium]REK32320.1 MAG: response regulator [Bacteroidota bacterium]REK49554.1 MAG: response regulator [Bacteroidota bacterium]
MYTDRPIKIILIDDDASMSEMLKDFFKTNYPASELIYFSSGERALQDIYLTPDMIVLDYHLDSSDPAAMNGMQVLKKLKTRFPDVPVIFLSGQEKAEVAANTMKYGAYDYVVKNEHAFHRLSIITNNLLGHSDLRKNLGTQKFFNIFLGILLIALVLGIIIIRMT